MKYYNKFLLAIATSAILASCADEFNSDLKVSMPEDMARYEYLNAYDALKTYINRTANPSFKLGSGITVSDFLKKELVYSLACANFDELTAGNAMKYSSCVANDGSMDFSQIVKFVDAAKGAGLNIYGHTLVWHAQQNNTYLNGLIAPTVIPGEGGDGGYAFHVYNPSLTAGYWNVQSSYNISPIEDGATYEVNFMVKGDAEGKIRPEFQSASYASDGFGVADVTTDWQEHTSTTTVTAADRIRLIISYGEFAGNLYIDNISIRKVNSNGTKGDNLIKNGDFEEGHITGWGGWGNSATFTLSALGEGYTAVGDIIIEKTPEEKKEILTEALETWIAGMMEACNGYVKSWEIVNEPMSDVNAGELKSDPDHTDTDRFYWQDYLGKDYARTAVGIARQYGGDDLVLFINDYNLEATYNNNAKCEGLIKMVEYWESDGVTRIDGIGTQMHISYDTDADRQAKQEECIVKMYELLAASGKLIKVTELDMGILDENGDAIKTVNLTFEQHQLMSDFYKFIVKKYFELIPVSQQYGIAHWSPTDSPDADNSYWRRGEPVGLWNVNYNRKPAYSGFADGLGGNQNNR